MLFIKNIKINIFSPKQFKEFAFPYIKELVDYDHEKGTPIILHICGKTTLIIEEMANTGADVLSVDVIDLELAKEKVGYKVIILGNVNPSGDLLKGTPESVREKVKHIIEVGKDSPKGIIVASGCEVPINSPFENVKALVDAIKEYG